MAQVTIYLDSTVESKLREAAKSSQLSVSKWVAKVIEEKVTTQWSPEVVGLAGSWQDDFPTLETIRTGMQGDSKREDL